MSDQAGGRRDPSRRRRRRRATAEQGPPPPMTPPRTTSPPTAPPAAAEAPPAAAEAPPPAARPAGKPGRRRDTGADRGLHDIVGAGRSQLGVSGALRGRDVNRPSDDDLAQAEREVVIVRRNWKPDER